MAVLYSYNRIKDSVISAVIWLEGLFIVLIKKFKQLQPEKSGMMFLH